jgi:hypothetical protein
MEEELMITGLSLRTGRIRTSHHHQKSVQPEFDRRYHGLGRLKIRKDVIGSNGTLSPIITAIATTVSAILGFGRIVYGLALP